VPHDLGLDRQHHGAGTACHVIVRLLDNHAGKVPRQRRALFDRGFGNEQVLRRVFALDEAGGDRARHVAAADESDVIVVHDRSVRICSGVARAEYGRADPHDGRTFHYRRAKIVAHAH
jgi:hypothetical protein